MWCAPLPTPGPAPDTAPAQKKLKHLRVDATSMQVSLPVAMTWWAQRSALPRTRRVGRCRGGCAGGRCCTCRSGIRTALPDARIAVDKWHLVALANLMVTQVRQRITRQLHGRRACRQGTPAPAAGRTPAAPDPAQAVRLLRRRRPRRHGGNQPPGDHDRHLVASGARRAHRGRDQRPHRGLQPDHQANQACRMRLHQHGQLPKAHHGPHRPHPRAETSSMKSAHAPLKCGEPLTGCRWERARSPSWRVHGSSRWTTHRWSTRPAD